MKKLILELSDVDRVIKKEYHVENDVAANLERHAVISEVDRLVFMDYAGERPKERTIYKRKILSVRVTELQEV